MGILIYDIGVADRNTKQRSLHEFLTLSHYYYYDQSATKD